MKKLIAFFLAVFLLIGTGIEAIAVSPETTKVSILGKEVTVNTANVTFNGQPIETDVPPIVLNERILVPIRSIGNHLNAKIEWNQETKEASIETSSDKIILTLNSSKVKVNDEEKEIPYGVPAISVNDARIMVPLRFVSEVLGCLVEWNQETFTGEITTPINEITGVEIEETNTSNARIVLNTKGDITFTDEYSTSPYRLIVDFHNSQLNIDEDLIDSNGTVVMEPEEFSIESIRLAQISDDPDTVRMVVDLEEHAGYSIKTTDNNKITISFLNNVQDITSKSIRRREAIVIKNSDEIEYNMFTLSEPNRVVLDIFDSKLWTENLEMDIDSEFVERVRSSQFSPNGEYSDREDIVRVVLDIAEGKEIPNIMLDTYKNELRIFVDDEEFDNFSYKNTKYEDGEIKINAENRTEYSVEYNENSRLMEIKVDKDDIDIEKGIMTVNDENIKNIIVDEDEDNKIISISFNNDIDYEVLSKDKDDTIELLFKKAENNNSKLIVIDAGHGGSAVGTIGITTKIFEKDLNLKVALKLDEKLRELGFRTILTRSKDEVVDLYERADIANRNNADAFISIHFNAHDKSSISGIETLYCPAFNSNVKESDNYPFAYAIHNAVIEALNRTDRGIIKRSDLVVVRETKMVAALVELGFISNPNEEQIVITDEYHEKAAEAIAQGIVDYFNSLEK